MAYSLVSACSKKEKEDSSCECGCILDTVRWIAPKLVKNGFISHLVFVCVPDFPVEFKLVELNRALRAELRPFFTILGTQMHAESQDCAQRELGRGNIRAQFGYSPIPNTFGSPRIHGSDKLKADAISHNAGEAD